ncbi:MAG: phage tail protein [Azonexus sp.]|jgi:hypothetical protein|nr:phage tail protein [Azonexus sp.]
MGSGKKVTIGYEYFMGIHMGLCRGPVDEIVAIEAGGKTVWSGSATGNSVININQPNLFGGKKKEGGIQGPLDVMMGGPSQTAPAALAAMLGGDVPGFRGVVTLFFNGLVSAMTPYLKPWRQRLRRSQAGWDGPAWLPARAKIVLGSATTGPQSIHAMNPAHIIYECLTNRAWGGGNDRARLSDASFTAAANTLYAEGFGLCLRWTRQDSINGFIQIILDHIGANLVQSRFDGLLHLKLIRDDYDPATLPLFDEDSGLIAIDDDDNGASDGAVNEIIVKWRDPVKNEDRNWRERNLAGVASAGRLISQTVDYPGLPTAELAGRVAARDLAVRASTIKRFKLRLDRRAYKIQPGDVFRIRSTRRGIDNLVLRAGRVEDGTLTDGAITITAVQDIFGLPAAAMSAPQPPGWQPPDRTPVAISQRRVLEATWRDLATVMDAANLALIDPTAGYLTALAARPTPASFNFEAETRVGSAAFAAEFTADFIPTGLLSAALTPTATSFIVDPGSDLDFAEPGPSTGSGQAVLIDNEIMRLVAWNAATRTGTVARGCVDTVPAAHAAATRVWFLDASPEITTAYTAGTTVQTRLIPSTSQARLDPALAAIDSLAVAARQARPYPPGRVRINGQAYPASVTGEITVTWAHRDRLLQADQLIDSDQGNIGPEPGVTYRLRIYNGSTLVRTYSGLTGASQTYLTADETADGGPFNPIRLVLDAERSGLFSGQAVDITVSRT